MSTSSSGADGAARPLDATPARALRRLRELLLREGGLMASLVGPSPDARCRDAVLAQGPAQLAAAGPRAEGRREQYELLVEAIYEGYLLHYYAPRVMRPPGADLGVLAGDRLYALGLDQLVKLGDMQAVAELADVITLSALAQAEGRTELADAVWMAGARAVGWGSSAAYDRAKALVRTGSLQALQTLHALAHA